MLRKRYYSNSLKDFKELPLSKNSSFDSRDIGSSGSNVDDVIRLVPYGSALSTSTLGELVSDLVYNDTLLESKNNQTSSVLSDGIGSGSGRDFSILKIKYPSFSGGQSYLSSFGILGGQIKFGEDFSIKSNEIRNKNFVSSPTTNSVILNDVTNLNVNDLVLSRSFPLGTQIISINNVTKEVTLDKTIINPLTVNDPLLFSKVDVFGITGQSGVHQFFAPFFGSGTQPIYRRDLIEYDLYNSTFHIVTGKEHSFLAPINTQLDSQYQIIGFSYVSGFEHEILLKSSLRDSLITSDFSVGSILKIRETDDKIFDGDWIITNIDAPNRKIRFKTNHVNSNSFYTSSTDRTIGSINIGRVALYSIPLIKHTSLAATYGSNILIIDRIENVIGFSGLRSSLQHVTQSLLQKDQDSFYGIKNRDYVHLCDNVGRLLDWESGQSYDQDPVIGYTSYNQNLISSESIENTTWIESSLPQNFNPPDESLLLNNFSNAPLFISTISDDVFSTTNVFLQEVNIAIKNDPISIGSEDIKYKLSKANIRTGYSAPRNCGIPTGNTSNIIINEIPAFLSTSGITVGDFVLITGGPGRGQVSKVLAFNLATGAISIESLRIPLSPLSSFVLLSGYIDVTGTLTITNSEVNSQVITGINGVFGLDGEYRKVKLSLPNVLINLNDYYFLCLSQTNTITPNPAWSNPPKILISSFDTTDTYWSPFLEVFYKTVQGLYGASIENYILIEDDLGDIGVENSFREFEPHFRPKKYILIARGLDDSLTSLQEPQSEDIVFVDVHTGRIRFKSGSEPKNVYVSYYKRDSFSGDATDFSITFKTVNDSRNRTLQDKLYEIERPYKQGGVFEYPTSFNGIKTSFSNEGFKGPFFVDPFDSFHIKYSLPQFFNNHKINHKDFMVKFSNHYFDEIIKTEKNSVYILNDSFLVENIIDEDAFSNHSNTAFLDYVETTNENIVSPFPNVSGTINNEKIDFNTLSSPSSNIYDEIISPVGTSINIGSSLLKKKWNSGLEDDFSFSPDSAFFDTNPKVSIDGVWNDFQSSPFGEFQFLNVLYSKKYYQDILLPSSPSSKRRLKQRESIGVYTNQFEVTGIKRSVGKIISEPFNNYQKSLTSKDCEEAIFYATAENVKGDLELQNTHSGTLTSALVNISNKLYDYYVNDSFIHLIFVKPILGVQKVYLKKIEIKKDNNEIEINELTSIDTSSPEIEIFSNVTINKIKIINFDLLSYGLLYSDASGDMFFMLLDKTTFNILPGSLAQINKNTSQLGVSGLLDCIIVDDSALAITWCSGLSTLLNIYRYEYSSLSSSILKEITITSSASPTISPKLCRYYKNNNFVVSYSDNGVLRIKRFDSYGIPQNIANISSGVVVESSIQFFDSVEINDGSLLFGYRKSGATDNYVLKKFDESNEVFTESAVFLSDTASNPVLLIKNDENRFTVITKDSSNSLIRKVYFNNLIEISNSSTVWIEEFPKVHKTTQHSFVEIYENTAKTDLLYKLHQNRPDVLKKYRTNTPVSNQNITSDFFKTLSLSDNQEILLYKNATNFNIELYDRYDKNSYTYKAINFFNTEVVSDFDAVFIKENVQLVFISKIKSNKLSFDVYKKTSSMGGWSFFINIPSSQTDVSLGNLASKNIVSTRLLYLGSNKLLVAACEATTCYLNIIDISDFLTSSFPSLVPANSTFSLSSVRTLSISDPQCIKFNVLQTKDNYVHAIGIYYINSTLRGAIFESSPLLISNYNTDTLLTPNLFSINIKTTLLSKDVFDVSNINDVKNKTFGIVSVSSTNNVEIRNVTFDLQTKTMTIGTPVGSVAASSVRSFVSIDFCNDKKSYDVFFYVGTNTIKLYTLIFDTVTNVYTFVDSSLSIISVGNTAFSLTKLRDSYTLSYNDTTGIKLQNIVSYPLSLPQNESRVYKNGTSYYTLMYSSIKIGGVDFRGIPNEKVSVYTYNTRSLDTDLINDEGIFISTNTESANVSLLSYSSGTFWILFHDKNISLIDNYIKIRYFSFERNFVFPNIDWINLEIDTLTQTNLPKSTRVDLSMFSTERDNDILAVYNYSNDIKFVRLQIQNDFSITPYSYSAYLGVKFYREIGISFKVLGLSNILDNNCAALIYGDDKKYRTLLINNNEDVLFTPNSFYINKFSRELDIVSKPIITPFGYFYHHYIKTSPSNKKLMLFQHGWNGTKFGSVQLVGKNYIEAIKTTPDSFVERAVKAAVISTGNTQRAEYSLNDGTLKQINDASFFPTSPGIESGIYDVFVKSDPTVSARFYFEKNLYKVSFISNSSDFVNKKTSGNVLIDADVGKVSLMQDSFGIYIVNKLGSNFDFVFIRNT